MKKFIYSFAALGLVTGAAYAQPAPPDEGAQTSTEGVDAGAPAGPLDQPADAVPPPAPAGPLDQAPDAAPPDADAPPDAAVPADPAATAQTDTSYTDEQIDSFAEATVKVQEINADASLSAEGKQAQMAAAVTGAGLDSATYDEIGEAMATDADLRSRIQVAMGRYANPNAG